MLQGFRSAVKRKMEYKEQHQSSKFAYITSALLVLIVLVIGITTVNNFDQNEVGTDIAGKSFKKHGKRTDRRRYKNNNSGRG